MYRILVSVGALLSLLLPSVGQNVAADTPLSRFYYDCDGKQKVGDRFTSKVESVELNAPLSKQELAVGTIPVGAYVQDERAKPSHTYRHRKD